jgi:hypothetical protein
MSFSETLSSFLRLNCRSRLSTSRVAPAPLDRCPNGVFGITTCWQRFYHEAMRHTSAICSRTYLPPSWHCIRTACIENPIGGFGMMRY